MMFFQEYDDFIKIDPRKDRTLTRVTEESMTKRCEVTLPKWLVKDKTILDLGSCFGAYGHWALMNGAKHYTGVELQQKFSTESDKLLSKYHDKSKFEIVQEDALKFLKENNKQYDIVLAAGLIHGYTDVIQLLQLICKYSDQHVIIESLELQEDNFPKIEFKPQRMVIPKYNETGNFRYSEGITALVGVKALSFILNDSGFVADGLRIKPEKINTCKDVYNTEIEDVKTNKYISPNVSTATRYICRFKKSDDVKRITLQNNIHKNSGNILPKSWQFDGEVANRFQQEARTNIPDYDRVIGMCLQLANKKLKKDAAIIDVGSALGFTLDIFTNDDFSNIIGVDSSQEMIDLCKFKSKVVLSNKLPVGKYDMVMANWTLHFVNERREYIQDIYDNMNDDGIFVLSDKTPQDDTIKEMYYDFKRYNGIDDAYIYEKEQKLKGYMNLMSVEWYMQTLNDIGFKSVQIINSRLGFVTFYCNK